MIEIIATTPRGLTPTFGRIRQALTARGAVLRPDGAFVLVPMTGARILVRRRRFRWRFSVDTEVHGPGLHAAFYKLLKELAAELKLTYHMEDPTHYYKDMDPERLNQFYRQELTDIARTLAAQPENARLQVHWTLPGFTLTEGAGVAGPISRWSRSRFLSRVRDDMDGLMEDFYIAPHLAEDGVYVRNEALFLLQNEITYLREGEEDAAERICQLLEQAARLHPTLPLPLEEYTRCAALCGHEPQHLTNPKLSWGLIGYRREQLRGDMGAFSWVFPGHFRGQPAEETPWMQLGDGRFTCTWALVPYDGETDPHADYPELEQAPAFRGVPAPELARDDVSQGLKASCRLGDQQLIVLICFEAPYTWEDVFAFLNSVEEK